MLEIRLDAVSSCLNFAGGAVLSLDALMVRSRTKQKHGAAKFVSAAREAAEKELLRNSAGHPINSTRSIQDWFDEETFRLALIGFVLLLFGFGLDLFCKVFANPLLLA